MKNFLCTAALLALTLSAHAQSLVVLDLGTLGGPTSGATAINNVTRVTGQADTLPGANTPGPVRAFSWNQGTGMSNLGSLGGKLSISTAISNATTGLPEAIVGFSTLSGESVTRAFLVRSNSLLNLGTLGGASSFARAVRTTFDHQLRPTSLVAGSAQNATGLERACLWAVTNSTGAISRQDLGTLGGNTSAAFGMNKAGSIVGTAMLTGNHQLHPFFIQSGTSALQDIGTLGGANGVAFAVNTTNSVVGEADTTGGVRHAFIWTPTIEQFPAADLGTLGGKTSSARAIATDGTIVGTAQDSRGNAKAVKWDPGTRQIVDLNSLIDPAQGWVLQVATGTNDSGQIVGQGLRNGVLRAFLLTTEIQ